MKKTSAEKAANSARAEAAFKPVVPNAAPQSEQAREKEAFDKNRERLKAERLAREAEPGKNNSK